MNDRKFFNALREARISELLYDLELEFPDLVIDKCQVCDRPFMLHTVRLGSLRCP